MNRSPLLRTLAAFAFALSLRAQAPGFFYREIPKEGRIHVFSTPAAYEAFRAGGAAPAGAVTINGAGPHGEALVAENRAAAELYDYKHGRTPDVAEDALFAAPPQPAPAAPAVPPAPAAAPETPKFGIAWKPGGTTLTLPNFEIRFGARLQLGVTRDRNDYCGDCDNVAGYQTTRIAAAGVSVTTLLPFTTTRTGDPTTGRAYATTTFAVRKLKPFLQGWAFDRRIRYDVQFDITPGGGASNVGLREANVEFAFRPWLTLKAGQWKAPYGRQRFQSDGRLQFQDVSIATAAFSTNLEDGAMLWGTFGGKSGDRFEYDAGVFSGAGQNPAATGGNGDDTPLYMARLVWMPFGKADYTEGAVENPARPKAWLGGSWNRNLARSGIGTLKETAVVTEKTGVEAGFAWKRFSANGEWFRAVTRTVSDNFSSAYNPATGAPAVKTSVQRAETDARGWFLQSGFFVLPRRLELAARWSESDPNRLVRGQQTAEWRFGVNGYLSGSHFHKLQFDWGRLTRRFNGRYVAAPVTLPIPLPAGRTDASFDDRTSGEDQIRLQYQLWF